MDFLALFILAILAESVWETLKMTWQKGKVSIDRIGALIVSLIITFGTGLDITTSLQVPMKIPFLGVILTGILLSRGSNFIHDLIVKINSSEKLIKNIEKSFAEDSNKRKEGE